AGNHAEDLKIDILQPTKSLRNINQNVESKIDDLAIMVENLNFLDPMQVENNVVKDLNEVDKIDNSLKVSIVSANSMLKGLNTISIYLLQQNNT
ncbi:25047_t:CDS:2, partial [Gigaspora rosea]